MEVIRNLYVGGDEDYEKVKDNKDFDIIRCCKFGPGSHKEILKYKPSSPKFK